MTLGVDSGENEATPEDEAGYEEDLEDDIPIPQRTFTKARASPLKKFRQVPLKI